MIVATDDPRIQSGMAAQLARRGERIAGGDAALGWKVGLGTPPAMQKLGIGGPLLGFLSASGRIPSGGTVSLKEWVKPSAEPELAIHIGRDLPGDCDEAAVRAAIAAIGPAIELVDINPPPEDVEAILTDNIFHRRVVLGTPDPARAGGNVSDLSATVRRNGVVIAEVENLEATTGRLVTIARYVAGTLAAAGETLRAGQVIIAGSIIPAIALAPDDREIAYDVKGLGSVSVRFEEA
jgi:2-keto-4-pentenoate hydratase